MTHNEIPLVAFFKRMVDPSVILGSLYIVLVAMGEQFNGHYLVLMIIAFFVGTYVYDQIDLYRPLRSGRLLAFTRDTLIGWAIVVGVLMLIGHATGFSYEYSDRVMLVWFVVAPIALLSSHLAAYGIVVTRTKSTEMRSALIVGANEPGIKISERIFANPYFYIDVKGYFDDRDESRRSLGLTSPHLGKLSDIVPYVREHNVNLIFISLPISAQPRILELLEALQDTTASIYFVPDIYTFELMQARLDHIGGVPVVGICETPFTGINGAIKRVSDIVLALCILILLVPILIAIGIGVKLTSPGPIIFKQRRYGLNGEEIIVYKFRSMAVCEDGAVIVQAQRNDQRITKFGTFLRSSSLDELPQFFNVLQGRMSIVGPRPHAVAHNEMYRKLIKGYMLRHKVKPGITGWAQVNGYRGETDTLEKMKSRIEFDLDYLRNWSMPLDLWIILRTVREVTRRNSAY
jgi:putative colanic acid biosynthesis UDP-glucose lipid carrier transferase